MKFGAVPIADAIGGVAVHSIRAPGIVLKKGTTVGEGEVAALRRAGIDTIVVARLDAGDVNENTAAGEIATAVAGAGTRVDRAFTGRCNIFAETAGVLVLAEGAIIRINAIDEAITLATLPNYKAVVAGEMLATVKIIPFAVPGPARDAALETARADQPLVRVAPYRITRVGVVSTLLPGLTDKVIDKTIAVTAERLARAGASIVHELRVPHEPAALTAALRRSLEGGAELVVAFGASAIADRRDVIPAAIEAIGGRVEHFGMPVDPGNLMLIAEANGRAIVGAPGCARSPKENGFDWILTRLLAGLPVRRADIAGLGVGGLLMEIVTRPQPRDEPAAAPRQDAEVAAVVLAAGQSRRMGGPNKMLEEVGGRPLVRRAVEQAMASRARPVVVVTGHQRERVEAALSGLPVVLTHNPHYADGLSSSLKAGIAALGPESDGAVICLADMPLVDAALIDRMVAAFNPAQGGLIVLPTVDGKRGNPVLWGRQFFPELADLHGDVGARHLIGDHADAVVEVPVEGRAVFLDLDTPEALRAFKSGAGTV